MAILLPALGMVSAQSYYDDDIYFDASKAEKPKPVAKSTTGSSYYQTADYPSADSYTVTGTRNISVDDYNRRGIFASDSVSADSTVNDFKYTRNIERYYNPDVVASQNDPELSNIYYMEPDQVNIYLNTPSGYWGYNYLTPAAVWNLSFGYPYYYNYWRWNSPWYWNSWYDPYWSWNWGWGWGPSWAWGPSWSWGPSWGWGWSRPRSPRHPGGWGNSGYRPGNVPASGVRPGWSNGGRHQGSTVRPGSNNGNYRPGNSNGMYRPGFNNNTRPGNNGTYRPGNNTRPNNNNNNYNRPNNNNSNYNRPSYNNGGRTPSFGGGGSRGGFSGGGGSGRSAGGRGRH